MTLRNLLLIAIMWAAGGCNSALAQTTGTGHIKGQVTDKSGEILPGARVTVAGPALHQVAITDANGRFDVEGLVQGWPSNYTITTELVGFLPATVEKIIADVGGAVHVPVALELGPVCDVVWVDFGLAESLKLADFVVLVRIESSTSTRPLKSPDYCIQSTEYLATVVDTVKDTHSSSPTRLRFSVFERNDTRDSTSEYIAFLRWESSLGKYQALMPGYFVPVEAGWVHWTALNTLGLPNVAPVSAVLEALRSLSAQR